MVKFVLFLIFILLSLQNSYEDSPEEIEAEEAADKVRNLMKDIRKLYNCINEEIFFYGLIHVDKINKIIKEFDMKSVNNELNDKINEIDKTEINQHSEALFCTTDAIIASNDAWEEHENSIKKCSSKTDFIWKAITIELTAIGQTVDKMHNETLTGYNHCLDDNKEPTPEIITKCMQNLTNKFRPRLEFQEENFEKKAPTMRATADDSLTNLRKCLEQIKDFQQISDDIIKTFKKCAKDNSATSIYSKSILYLCLCLFCLLRMI